MMTTMTNDSTVIKLSPMFDLIYLTFASHGSRPNRDQRESCRNRFFLWDWSSCFDIVPQPIHHRIRVLSCRFSLLRFSAIPILLSFLSFKTFVYCISPAHKLWLILHCHFFHRIIPNRPSHLFAVFKWNTPSVPCWNLIYCQLSYHLDRVHDVWKLYSKTDYGLLANRRNTVRGFLSFRN